MWTVDSALVIDRHVIAGISIAGTVCDVMGGLYLAYDLLGGNNGPLEYSDPVKNWRNNRLIRLFQ